jgi:rod shape determining protein RodA
MLRFFKSIDPLLYLFPILLWIVSCVVLWSLTYASSEPSVHILAIKQLVFGLIGITIMIAMTILDYRMLYGSSWLIGLVTVLLLIAVEFFGQTTLGATRWLDLKIFNLQPSEVAKLGLVIFLATYLSSHVEKPTIRSFFIVGGALLLPVVLVLIQPDLGTALILIVASLGILIALKLRSIHFFALGIVFLLALSVSALSYYKITPFNYLLKDYQRNRITTFINPESDPLGKGYNVRQAMIAVGNGGIYGRGLGKEVGQLSQLNFLPKAYTDFIFAALAESAGIIGASIVLLLYGGLFWRILSTAKNAKDNFAQLISFGYLSSTAFAMFINIGMNLGVMPVTGIPLPFISAGGTALIINFVAIGILQSIYIRRQAIKFD